jgi:mRNA interferase MazF
MNIRRGDVVLVDLAPSKGSEQDKTRPAVIIQNDVGNEHSPTTIIALLTSSYEEPYPTDVELLTKDTCVEEDSVVQLNQIRTVSLNHRIQDKVGSLSDQTMRGVDKAIRVSLGL